MKQKNYPDDLKKVIDYVNTVGEKIARFKLCHKCWRKYLKEKNTKKLKK